MNRRTRRSFRGIQRRSARYAHAWTAADPGVFCLAIHPCGQVCSLDALHPGEHVALDPDEHPVATWARGACRVALAAADPGQI